MYVFIGTLAVAWVGEGGYVLVANIRTLFRKRRHAAKAGWADAARTVTLGVVVATALMAFLWGGVITRTGEGVAPTGYFPPAGQTPRRSSISTRRRRCRPARRIPRNIFPSRMRSPFRYTR